MLFRSVDKTHESLLRLLFTVFGISLAIWGARAGVFGQVGAHPVLPLTLGAACLLAALSAGRVRPCVAASFGCTILVAAVASRATMTNGLSSPEMLWAAMPPFMAIALGGRKSVRPMMVVSASAIGSLLIMHLVGRFPSRNEASPVVLAMSHGGLAAVLMFSAWNTRRRHHHSMGVVERANKALQAEVYGHEETRATLDTTIGEMLHIARRAGMGEVATGVLHNVGNALNGVNTSVALAITAVDRSDFSLDRVAALLEGEVSAEKQHKVAQYLYRLDESIAGRRTHLRDELARIRQSAEHVAAIVQAQQRLATTGAIVEVVQAADLLAQSRLLLEASLKRHEIVLDEDLATGLRLSTDRHRVIQILTNLIGNARDALRNAHGERTITIRCRQVGTDVRFDVRDTGHGVPQALQERIFTHGFTTKDDGHGFGLHASALAASEIGGRLTLEPSTRGAHFRLVIPSDPTTAVDSRAIGMRESFVPQAVIPPTPQTAAPV